MRLKNQVNAAGFEQIKERFDGKPEDIEANITNGFSANAKTPDPEDFSFFNWRGAAGPCVTFWET